MEIAITKEELPKICRQGIPELLNDIYGYEEFRQFDIYKDLDVDKTTITVSQGQLIEQVVCESEKGIVSDKGIHNYILTAPTGSGKSLLFQLPAIYLGKKYQWLTIVVSPLKALMEDQVDNLREVGYDKVDYASSDLSPEEKNAVYERVRNGETDLFYLSPELLLSYDIKHFIGDRRIGLLVVDEAHTVTTWGKEFRVDYWFLGRYLKNLKSSLGYAFPIFALTATAVYNPDGDNDMVFETIRSLRLSPCVLYCGKVKRDNIKFDIKKMEIMEGQTYDHAKQDVILKRTDDFLADHKTILYYPFAASIDTRVKMWVSPANRHLVSTYYGKKDKTSKSAIVEAFREGVKRMIVATKAFGMGVDISDIDRIYHVAPSSTFVDYVQEIGRAARDKNIIGVSATDFNERDFYYMNRLHMISSISQEQLGLILKKLWDIYVMKGKQKEMQVALSDFEFAVRIPRKPNKVEYESDLAQVIKTALLWIEEDLNKRNKQQVMEVNPLKLFTDGYIREKSGNAAFLETYKKYLQPVDGQDNIYHVAFEKLWEDCFPVIPYGEFKHNLYNGTLFDGVCAVAVGKHEVMLLEDAETINDKLCSLLKRISNMLTVARLGNKGKFEEEDIEAIFKEYTMDVPSAKRFIYSLLESRVEEGRSLSLITSQKKKGQDKLVFTVKRGFDLLLDRYGKLCKKCIIGEKGSRLLFFVTLFSDMNMLLNLLSMLNLIDYTVEGGIQSVNVSFVQPDVIRQIVENGDYGNLVLRNNEKVFQEQIELYRLFFGNTNLTDEERWNFIESYFTGSSVEELKGLYGKSNR